MTSPSPSVDPVRERLQQISNEWANHDDGGTPALIAAIEAVLDGIDKAAGRLPGERASAKRARNLGERYYTEGLTDGCELAFKEIRAAIAAGLGVTP